MTQPIKLSIDEIEYLLEISGGASWEQVYRQCIDTMRENERLQAIADEAWAFFCAITDDVPLLKSYKDSAHGCPKCAGAICVCEGFKPTLGDKDSSHG